MLAKTSSARATIDCSTGLWGRLRLSRGPAHVAIIMDGNGRWAEARGLPRVEGHRRGVEALRQTVAATIELNIPYLTVFSFSSENWSRPESEINDLMGLLKRFIRRDLAELHRAGVKINVIGSRTGVAADIALLLDEAELLTRDNTALTLQIAFNYGGRAEIVEAARRIAYRVKSGEVEPAEIDAALFSGSLYTAGVPDPDLLIRTSGELRLSNFLLWQLAYSELVFLDVFWPEFSRDHLNQALAMYSARQRRFGGRASQTAS